MTNNGQKREAGALALMRKHSFEKVESTRYMAESSLDPMLIRTRMEARGSDLDYDDSDTLETILARVRRNQAKMEEASIMLDAELDVAGSVN